MAASVLGSERDGRWEGSAGMQLIGNYYDFTDIDSISESNNNAIMQIDYPCHINNSSQAHEQRTGQQIINVKEMTK